MKKLFSSTIVSLAILTNLFITPSIALAFGCPAGEIHSNVNDTNSGCVTAVTTPGAINIFPDTTKGYDTLGAFIGNFLTLALAIGILVVLVFLIWGAFEWITSGGDKEAVGKARGRIINALIGLAVLAVAFALARVAGQFLGFTDLNHIIIPGPATNPATPTTGGGAL